jgi:hypothetical protein
MNGAADFYHFLYFVDIMKYVIALSALLFLATASCKKEKQSDEQQLEGTWVRVGTDGTGPAGTLVFSEVNGRKMLQFNCSGSPGPGWPTTANTTYSIGNGKLSFVDYSNNNGTVYVADSFTWITKGEEFEIKLYQLLLYMSADYKVQYKKVN